MKKKKMKKGMWLTLYIVLFVFCVLAIYVVPSIAHLFESTYIAESGNVKTAYDEEAYILRDEYVFVSDRDGKVKRLDKEGQLIKGNSKVVEIADQKADSKSDRYAEILKNLGNAKKPAGSGFSDISGYVSYYIDGYEAKLNPSEMYKLSKKKIEDMNISSGRDTVTGQCSKGEPVFKIASNSSWYIIIFTDKDRAASYVKDDDVSFRLGRRSAPVDGYVYSVVKTKDGAKVIICSDMGLSDHLKERKVKVNITTADADGIIIKNKSIVKKNGFPGVIVKDKLGNYKFKPIAIKARNDKVSAVCQDLFMDEKGEFVKTIAIYDEVVKNPTKGDIKKAVDINATDSKKDKKTAESKASPSSQNTKKSEKKGGKK